jgi:hypothetical protein
MQSLLNSSWRKAIAFNDWKQKGGAKPLAVAGILQADHLPERNPAFHPSASEVLLKVAIAKAARDRAAGEGDKPAPRLALAAAASAPRLERAESPEPAETAEQEQGDTDKEVIPSDEAAFGPYHIQVGSYLNSGSAKNRLVSVAGKASGLLDGHEELTVSGEVRGTSYYRARFGQFSRDAAARACAKLKRLSVDCLVVRVE